mgnify:CR=1 FL=1
MPKETFFNLPDEKRRRIVDVAIDEFAENSYRNVSVSRLVARADIAKGSFYQYFEDKRDLYLYLLDLASEEKLAFLQAQEPPDPQMALFAYLGWLYEGGARFQFSHPRLAQVGYRALYTDAPFREELLKRMKNAATAFYRQLIEQGIERGDIDPRVDPDMAAFVLGTLLNEFGNYLIEQIGLDPQRLAESGLSAEEYERFGEQVDAFLYVLEHGIGSD